MYELNDNYAKLVKAMLNSALREADREFLEGAYCKNLMDTVDIHVSTSDIDPVTEANKQRFKNMSIAQIASDLNTTVEGARVYMQKLGWEYKTQINRNVNTTIIRLLKMGYKQYVISEFLNVSTKTISRIAKTYKEAK